MDATIAGGNSGGTAVDHEGQLVCIPTQAAAGEGITPVDARPVVDTNRDGGVDQRGTPMTFGGFINGLRPRSIDLAKPLLQQAGVKVKGFKPARSGKPGPRGVSTIPKATGRTTVSLSNLPRENSRVPGSGTLSS